MHQGAVALIDVEEGAANWCRQRAASVVDQTASHSRWSLPSVFMRPRLVICWQITGKWWFFFLWEGKGLAPGSALACWFGVEPPAGIEPATPSLPWNHREPLCGPPFPQVTPDRQGQSYRFSSGEGMRSLQPCAGRLAGVVAAPAEAPVHYPLGAGGGPAGTPLPPPGSPWPLPG
jgi:hypothetical protein